MPPNKPNCQKASNTWCIKFEFVNYEELESRTLYTGRFVETILKRVYKIINEKCKKSCSIPTEDILVTQEDVDVHTFCALFKGTGDGFNRSFFTKNEKNPPRGWSAFT